MFIDVHAHAYRGGPPQDGRTLFTTPAQLIQRYDELEIDCGCILPLIGPEVYLPQSNEDVLEFCAASGGRLLPFCNIDPRGIRNTADAPLDIWLTHYRDRGCLGVGEVMPNLPFGEPRVQNLFAHVERLGLPLTFDISTRIGGVYGLYDDPGLPQLAASLARFPGLRILGHGPAFWAEIGALRDPADRAGYPGYPVDAEGAVPRLFRDCPNLLGDLSAHSGYNALARDPDYACRFIDEFQDRLFFGTDICGPNQPVPLIPFLRDLDHRGKLAAGAFRKIARDNAVALLGL